jgi:hypothetical protein
VEYIPLDGQQHASPTGPAAFKLTAFTGQRSGGRPGRPAQIYAAAMQDF